MTQQKQLHVLVSGVVQGVWYRASTEAKAKSLHLTGWVRNRRDGRVELVAEGNIADLESLVEWCWQGPDNAQVRQVDLEWRTFTGGFDVFETTHTF